MKKYFVILLALFLFETSGYAQNEPYQFIRSSFFQTTFHIKSWSFDGTQALDRYTEFAIPVVYTVPFGSRLAIDVVTSPFISIKEDPGGGTSEFHNISDTFVRSSFILGDNNALLTFGIGIPTGETNLDASEYTISGIAANRSLDNPVSNFGTGFSYNFGLAVAQEFGDWVVGVGGGYSLRQQYDATFAGQSFQIEPGDEFNLTIGLERDFEIASGKGKFTADFIYTNFSEDKIDGASFFEAGDKLLFRGQLIVPFASFNPLILSVTERIRSDNRSPNPDILNNGNELELRATLVHRLSGGLHLKYVGRTQIYGDNNNSAGGATIFGIGGGVVFNFSQHVSFDPTFIFSKGSINTGPNSDINITGLELTGGLAFKF